METGLRHADRIFVAGHKGLVGSALVETLQRKGYTNIVTRTREELDLTDQRGVVDFFAKNQVDAVFLAAAKVGGIFANNTYRAEFIAENLQIQNSVILAANRSNVRRLVFLGSSCIYPRECPQPMREEDLLTGSLEYTNRPYAIAKIAGIELVNSIRQQYGREWFSVMPTNLYGPRDNFHPEHSHVLPALLRRFEEARVSGAPEVVVWGSGKPRREFMYSLDCAETIVQLAEHTMLDEIFANRFDRRWSHVNVGVGSDVSISELATMIAECVGYKGVVRFDASKPDGTPRKLLNVDIINNLGIGSAISLATGIKQTLDWFRASAREAGRTLR